MSLWTNIFSQLAKPSWKSHQRWALHPIGYRWLARSIWCRYAQVYIERMCLMQSHGFQTKYLSNVQNSQLIWRRCPDANQMLKQQEHTETKIKNETSEWSFKMKNLIWHWLHEKVQGNRWNSFPNVFARWLAEQTPAQTLHLHGPLLQQTKCLILTVKFETNKTLVYN